MITRVDEYAGEKEIRIAATQLGTAYSAHEGRKVVDQWCAFFDTAPTPIQSLAFTTRTPRRLFAALRRQTQLTALGVKWGDYDDLAPLGQMTSLRDLWLGGASAVTSVAPLTRLRQLDRLTIEGIQRLHDLAPLGELTNLSSLEVGGDWMTPRVAHVDSLAFLTSLAQLRELVLHTIVSDDLDYSALLELTTLDVCRVAPARGMRPSHAQLVDAIPALAEHY